MPWRIVAPALMFATGVWLSDATQPTGQLALAFGTLGVSALVVAWVIHRRREEPKPGDVLPRLSAWAIAMILIGCLVVGFATHGLRNAALVNSPWFGSEGFYEISGRVGSDVEPSGRGFAFRLKAESVNGQKASGSLHVRSFGDEPKILLGDSVTIGGTLSSLELAESFDRYLFRRHIVAKLTTSDLQIEVTGPSSNPVIRASNRFRERLREVAVKNLGTDRAGLLLGLTIGDERLIPESTVEEFRLTGLAHLTAVSGANVAMVLGAVILILRALRASKRLQVVAGIATVGFFAVVTRWEPSVLRASVMATLALAVFFFGRRSNPLHGLAASFLVLLAIDPMLLWSIGFQLSFAAAAGILLLTKHLLVRFRRLPKLAAEGLAVAISAQLAVTPLLAFHFGRVSLVSVPANLLAFPLVAPITVLGLAGGVVATFAAGPAGLLMDLAGFPVGWLEGVAHLSASVPWASVVSPLLGPLQVVVLYVFVLAIGLWIAGQARAGKGLGTAAATLWLVVVLVPAAGSEPPENAARFTFFDVGQGDSALIETPAGATVLVDGGRDSRLLTKLLKERGIGKIDLVVFTHFHADHVGGLEDIFDRFDVREAIHPGVGTPLGHAMGVIDRLDPVEAGERITIGDLTLDVLGPDSFFTELAIEEVSSGSGEGSELNDASVVLRVGWGEGCAVFPGDIEEFGQTSLLDQESMLECSMLKAPHHGSARLAEEFVAAVDPRWVVISVGRNQFGHPTETALRIFRGAGATVDRTDRSGHLVYEMDMSGQFFRVSES